MSSDLRTKLREFMRLRETRDAAKAAYDDAESAFRGYEADLWDELKESGQRSMSVDLGDPYGVVQFVPNATVRSKVLDPDALLEWANQNARTEELQKVDFRKRQLNEIVKDALDEGRDLPDGVDFSVTRYITPTRRKPKRTTTDLL